VIRILLLVSVAFGIAWASQSLAETPIESQSGLDRAFTICKTKIRASFLDTETGRYVYTWEVGFENCAKILKAKAVSYNAERELEQQFVDKIAAGLEK
jgi:hypothetical protein